MRAHVLSDIHFEHMSSSGLFFEKLEKVQKNDPADVIILAGDICQIGANEALWKSQVARLISGYKKAFYVPGNHEFYRSSFTDAAVFFDSLESDPNFHNLVQLSRGPHEYGGIRFIGNTMWFPDLGTSYRTKMGMSDFLVIGDSANPFEPAVYQEHEKFLLNVMGPVRQGDVVVTHHLPLKACIHPLYEHSALNPFFMADMSGHLNEAQMPRAWIHGHTHTPVDLQYKGMRVYCNPHAYPGERSNLKFWDRIGIDL